MYTLTAIKVQEKKQTTLIVEKFMDDVGHLLSKIIKYQWQAENHK